MKHILTSAALAVLAGTLAFGGAASAQPRHYDNGHHSSRDRGNHSRYDNNYRASTRHHGWRDRSDWRRGGYVGYADWHRGYRVDYRRHHLRAPPRGYEWRRVDNNYVLAAVATGLIASVILNGGY